MLVIEGAATPFLCEEPWQDYSVFDYPSVKDYCSICLLNDSPLTTPDSLNASLCYLPIIVPNRLGVNLNALPSAQKIVT